MSRRSRDKAQALPRSDRELGISASRRVELSQLEIDSRNKMYGSPYEPTPFGVLDDMLLDLDIDYERFSFVDLGAGKGRILCLASAWPWKRIIGVEFSRELHKIASAHLAQFRAPWQRCRDLQCTHADVAEWTPPPGPLVLFLFNPFGAPVLAQLFANLRKIDGDQPRELVVLYYMPVHEAVLTHVPGLEWKNAQEHWVIYTTAQRV